MKRFVPALLCAGILTPSISSHAIDLKQARFTQIINDVQVISGADKSTKPATTNDIFKMPDILRTGPNSRAELIAEDQTITRIGANTIFSFDTANRTIDLQKGSLLFHSPKGRGGGTVRTGSATASVLGTTIVVTTTPNGGFKVLVLEGDAEVKFLDGLAQHLDAGQMTFVLPGGGMSPIIVFRLDANIQGSQLIQGFDKNSLSSASRIGDEVTRQVRQITKGKAHDTGLLVGDNASPTSVETIDSNSRQPLLPRRNAFVPTLLPGGYTTVDGLTVRPFDENEPMSHAQFVASALSRDVEIKTGLPSSHTFVATGPFVVTKPGDVAINDFLPNPFFGFFGRNIAIKTANVNMAPFSAHRRFDFLAAQNINIPGSVSFNGLVPALYITALGQFNIAPGSTISVEAFNWYLNSVGSMNFNNVDFENSMGGTRFSTLGQLRMVNSSVHSDFDVHLFGHQGVILNNTTIHAVKDIVRIASDFADIGATPAIAINNSTINGVGGVILYGTGDVNVNNSAISSSSPFSFASMTSLGGSISLNGGLVSVGPLNSGLSHNLQMNAHTDITIAGTAVSADSVSAHAGRFITVNGNAAFTARTLTLNAGDGILLNNVTMNGQTLNLNAANDVAVRNVNLGALSDVNISAHTPVFENVNFGGNVNIRSDRGVLADNPNTGQAVQRGFVNFINGVTYANTLITSANQSTYINPVSGQGINISTRTP
jgi:hypothetical protein